MDEREKIFGRIREALAVLAPLPGDGHHPATARPAPAAPAAEARQWLPAVGDTFAARLAFFGAQAKALRAEFFLVENRQELAAVLTRLREAGQWKKIGVHQGELTDFAAATVGLPVCRTDSGYDVHDLESCDAGFTECDALVAQTGSVLVTARSAGGRALSVLPPHHVVLARREQLVADLPDAFALLKRKYSTHYPSFISFITGPSRTGDIERILVLGAHGPKRLTIVCV